MQPDTNDGSGTTYVYGKWYLSGNYMASGSYASALNADNWTGVDSSKGGKPSLIKSDTAFTVDSVTTQSAQDAYTTVLESVGASLPRRDTVDARIIDQVKGLNTTFASGTYGTNEGIIDTQDSVGGWPTLYSSTAPSDSDHDGIPDAWETAHGLNPYDSTDANTLDAQGYTMLEEYLNTITTDTSTTTATETAAAVIKEFKLEQNYPNPFNPTTTIAYQIPKQSSVTLKVYDLLGKEVATLVHETKTAGSYKAVFNGARLSSGIYFYKLTAGTYASVKKLMLVK
jgi:hypothetical protein